MNTIRSINNTEDRALIGMYNYYWDICTIWYSMLSPLIEDANGPKKKEMFGTKR